MLGPLMFGSGVALAQSKPEIITLPITRPADPVTLSIDLISAKIEVIGEDRVEIAQCDLDPAGIGPARRQLR